jgi:aryl-alcohol dehydrogenase
MVEPKSILNTCQRLPARAAVANDKTGPFTIEGVHVEAPRADEVLVDVRACGLCFTDLEAQAHLLTPPMVLGHEGVGRVRQVGAEVRTVRAGDRVVMSYPSCGVCAACIRRTPFHCADIMALKFAGQRPDGSAPLSLEGRRLSSAFFQQSSLATVALTTERNLVVVQGDEPDWLLAALPCGVMTGAGTVCNALALRPGESLLVTGGGAVGLAAVMTARRLGAGRITVVDRHESRLALARELGADDVLCAPASELEGALLALHPRGVDAALDTTGQMACIGPLFTALRRGGRCALVTVPSGLVNAYPMEAVFERALTLHHVLVGNAVAVDLIPQLLAWRREGGFPVERLVTRFAFDRINDAVAAMRSGAAVKAVLEMS